MKSIMFKVMACLWYCFETGVAVFFSVMLCTGQMEEFLSASPTATGLAFIASILLYLTTELQACGLRRSIDRYRGELDRLEASCLKLRGERSEAAGKEQGDD